MDSLKNPFVFPDRKVNRCLPCWILTACIILMLVIASTLGGCASSRVDYSGQILDANNNPIYPTLSQPELNPQTDANGNTVEE